MLASLADAPLVDPHLVYEPKYDGIRLVAEIKASGPVTLWSRAGNDKTAQFPEIAEALERWARRVERPIVIDGELVALDSRGRPVGFQHLQTRIHLTGGDAPAVPVAFIAFDLLREGGRDLRGLSFLDRRARLERLLPARVLRGSSRLRLSEMARGDGRALHARAVAEGWEGLVAKHDRSLYHSGRRTTAWRKLKITQEQEFVIGGWTEPRGTRSHLGALLLGVYDADGKTLTYTGHTGTGFDERELTRLMALLRPLETPTCPFRERPPANERPHWVKPTLVAQVRFAEWTSDGLLRQPVYLGLRDDKQARRVRREAALPAAARADRAAARVPSRAPARAALRASTGPAPAVLADLVAQLRAVEESRRDGHLHLPDGATLAVTNLHKVFWPGPKFTKGDLFRYYVQVAPALLPVIADRPLVMKRFPNGVAAKPFYQHRVLDAPPGVRVEPVSHGDEGDRPQIIGGRLLTLLYTTQLAAISQDPWFSRVGSLDAADHVALDLDPMPTVSFARVLDVARWIHDELVAMGATGFPKTSGSDGLHIYVPLPAGTPYETGLLFVQIVATLVASRHPAQATVERRVAARGDRVYIDCLQNVEGRTLASAYSARASEWAGVSTPLSWAEVDKGVRREDFTIASVPARLSDVGDLWSALGRAEGVDLARAVRRAEQATRARRP
jgi:bifunctional non-homologous end joining protein LigD